MSLNPNLNYNSILPSQMWPVKLPFRNSKKLDDMKMYSKGRKQLYKWVNCLETPWGIYRDFITCMTCIVYMITVKLF